MAVLNEMLFSKSSKIYNELFDEGLTYHPYMRYRMTLARLMPMLGLNFTEIYYSDKK